MRIELLHDEKLEILSIIKTWEREQLTQERLRMIQRETGIPARSIQILFWHYDTLSLFSEKDEFIFKGGTCVQSWLPYGLQRASVDLDFNSKVGNPNSIRDLIGSINKRSEEGGRTAYVKGCDYGSINYGFVDEQTGTMTFVRRMPSRFNESIRIGDDTIQGIEQRIQINYRNGWLPAIKPVIREPDFIVLKYAQPISRFEVIHSSIEDLIADKILATCNVHGFGRERFKDVYDLGMLLELERDNGSVMKKLSLIAREKGIEPVIFIEGSVETISRISDRSSEARGFTTMVGKDGRHRIPDWESFCFGLIDKLRGIYQNT